VPDRIHHLLTTLASPASTEPDISSASDGHRYHAFNFSSELKLPVAQLLGLRRTAAGETGFAPGKGQGPGEWSGEGALHASKVQSAESPHYVPRPSVVYTALIAGGLLMAVGGALVAILGLESI
jgi:hypothetical protein